jgi:hypothetical protein
MGITDYTLAIITLDKNFQSCGACPVFYVDDNESLQQKAL